MAATTALCAQFVKDILNNVPHTPADSYKLSLYASTAAIDQTTTAYTATGELSGGNYPAGGVALAPDADGTTDIVTQGAGATLRANAAGRYAGLDWADAAFANLTQSGLKANGFKFLVYNTTRSNHAVLYGSFPTNDADVSGDPTAATFTVTLPKTGNVVAKFTY